MEYRELSDVDIIKRIRQQDPDAMDYMLKKYCAMVRREARRFYLIGADEEDLIQEGMIGLFKAIRDYDSSKDTEFSAFARICITRQLLSAMTASNRKKHTPLNSYISFYAPVTEENAQITVQETLEGQISNPEKMLLDQERLKEIWKQIDERLSPFERKVLDYYLQGDSYEEIAQKLSKTKKAVDNAVQRIRGKLK